MEEQTNPLIYLYFLKILIWTLVYCCYHSAYVAKDK